MSYNSSGASQFALTYELSPIFFVGGQQTNLPSAAVPIISYTEGQLFPNGLLQAPSNLNPDSYFAHFVVEPGSTLVDNQIATYPVVNLAVAANAIIVNPLRVSLRMICPANEDLPYAAKQSKMTALVNTIKQHINQGGTFNVATPSYLYTGCLLVSLRDVSPQVSSDMSQVQTEYVWEFFQPLLTAQQAQQAESTQTARITAQTMNAGDPPGSQPLLSAIGSASPPNTGSLIPGSTGQAIGAVATQK